MNRIFTVLIVICQICLVALRTASAVTVDDVPVNSAALTPVATWTGVNSTNWADAENWSGAVPGVIASTTNTDSALFGRSAAHSPLAIDAGRNLQNIIFDSANVNRLTIGAFNGPALLLTAGGTIEVTATVVNAQTVDAPLLLEGDYVFTSDASSNSATLNFGGGITPGATSGTTTLTLGGGNAGANTIRGLLADNGSGELAVRMSGTGLWSLGGANSYSGGTEIDSGTLMTTASNALGVGPLTINAADDITAVLNLASDETISNAIMNQSGTGRAMINVAAGATLTSTGGLTVTGAFNSAGSGTLQIDGPLTLNNNSNLNLTSGTLRLAAKQSQATIGAADSVTIATGATLELAGSISELSSGARRANVINNGRLASGGMFLVSGINQQVGTIDGTGDTVIGEGSDLTADHIIQNALIIGGTADDTGLLTIAATDAGGNPLEQFSQPGRLIVAASLTPRDPFAAGIGSPNFHSDFSISDLNLPLMPSSGAILGDRLAVVPEPATVVLFGVALICLLFRDFRTSVGLRRLFAR
jgi:fibronectin-binding autotransporter adhesin